MKRKYHDADHHRPMVVKKQRKLLLDPAAPVAGFTPEFFLADGCGHELLPLFFERMHPIWYHNMRLVNRFLYGIVCTWEIAHPFVYNFDEWQATIQETYNFITLECSLSKALYFLDMVPGYLTYQRVNRASALIQCTMIRSKIVRETIQVAIRPSPFFDAKARFIKDRGRVVKETLIDLAKGLEAENISIDRVPPLLEAACDRLAHYALSHSAWPDTAAVVGPKTAFDHLLNMFYRKARNGLVDKH